MQIQINFRLFVSIYTKLNIKVQCRYSNDYSTYKISDRAENVWPKSKFFFSDSQVATATVSMASIVTIDGFVMVPLPM